jgi:Tol biopolymer transport system component
MTEDNRDAVLAASRARGRVPAPPPAPTQPTGPSFDLWLWEAGGGAPLKLTNSGPGRVSTRATVSADGRWVAFHSDADLLSEGLPPGTVEVWLYDTRSNALRRVTRASQPGRMSRYPAISADGSRVAFESDSDFLGEGIPRRQQEIWVYATEGGTFTRITRSPAAPDAQNLNAALDADGSIVAFASTVDFGTGQVARNADVWLAEVASGALTRITRASSEGRDSYGPVLDSAGTRVAFQSESDLLEHGDVAAEQWEIWIYDAIARSLSRVTRSEDAIRRSEAPSISADGTRIVFQSDADHGADGHPPELSEIWLYETGVPSLRRLTSAWRPDRDADSNPALHVEARLPRISGDGRMVAFSSNADLLGTGSSADRPHAWLLDSSSNELIRIDSGESQASGVAVSADGGRVALFRTNFDALPERLTTSETPSGPPLSADALRRDLDFFQAQIEGRWSYLRASGVDYLTPIARLRERAAAGMSRDEFGVELQRIIALFIDAHADVGGFRYPPGRLPFSIQATDDRFVAIRSSRAAFLDPAHPFITAIDGHALGDWISAAATDVPKSAPQRMVRDALRHIRDLQFVRAGMGIEPSATVRVQLESADGASSRELVLPVPAAAGGVGLWPRSASALLDGNVGYLRLEQMDQAAVQEIAYWMPRFRDTRGLIIDVRGNGGGGREALRSLFPYLMTESDAPLVVNAARYRLHPANDEDHLGGSRYMFREDWSEWSDPERAAIARFRETFTPQWSPPDAEFSPWHYLIMSRAMNPEAFFYSRPVVVLLDENSFSATDIFLSALKGWRNVTLLGTPSGGGSGRTETILLPGSLLEVKLSSMVSYQRDGRLFDGNGVAPDVLLHPSPEYHLTGGRDNVLERALEMLRP